MHYESVANAKQQVGIIAWSVIRWSFVHVRCAEVFGRTAKHFRKNLAVCSYHKNNLGSHSAGAVPLRGVFPSVTYSGHAGEDASSHETRAKTLRSREDYGVVFHTFGGRLPLRYLPCCWLDLKTYAEPDHTYRSLAREGFSLLSNFR